VTWQNFLGKDSVSIATKMKLFYAVARATQSYCAQIWGYTLFEEVDSLLWYFLKRILRLPTNTPTYALALETHLDNAHLHTLSLHLTYIYKTLFVYEEQRLPRFLSQEIIRRNIFWAPEISKLAELNNTLWQNSDINAETWYQQSRALLSNMRLTIFNQYTNRKLESATRIYKYIEPNTSTKYSNLSTSKISWIFKARCDLIRLNGSNYNSRGRRDCELCNLMEIEDLQHFIGRCPTLREYRVLYFAKTILNESDVIGLLNGNDNNFESLVLFLKNALKYRQQILLGDF